MKSVPKLSIIVPVYNVEKYLERCIDSILGQEFLDYEAILIDDESPDKCPQICDKYSEKLPNFSVVHKKNEGLGFARNTGIECAKGKYIAFLDSDDTISIEMYSKLLYEVSDGRLWEVLTARYFSAICLPDCKVMQVTA